MYLLLYIYFNLHRMKVDTYEKKNTFITIKIFHKSKFVFIL